MVAHGVAFLLLSAAVGYWVLERSSNQKKDLKTIGQVVGALIIVISFLGIACKIYFLSSRGKGMYCPAGVACPYRSKSAK